MLTMVANRFGTDWRGSVRASRVLPTDHAQRLEVRRRRTDDHLGLGDMGDPPRGQPLDGPRVGDQVGRADRDQVVDAVPRRPELLPQIAGALESFPKHSGPRSSRRGISGCGSAVTLAVSSRTWVTSAVAPRPACRCMRSTASAAGRTRTEPSRGCRAGRAARTASGRPPGTVVRHREPGDHADRGDGARFARGPRAMAVRSTGRCGLVSRPAPVIGGVGPAGPADRGGDRDAGPVGCGCAAGRSVAAAGPRAAVRSAGRERGSAPGRTTWPGSAGGSPSSTCSTCSQHHCMNWSAFCRTISAPRPAAPASADQGSAPGASAADRRAPCAGEPASTP